MENGPLRGCEGQVQVSCSPGCLQPLWELRCSWAGWETGAAPGLGLDHRRIPKFPPEVGHGPVILGDPGAPQRGQGEGGWRGVGRKSGRKTEVLRNLGGGKALDAICVGLFGGRGTVSVGEGWTGHRGGVELYTPILSGL